MVYFTTCGMYIESITDIKAKIAAIDTIISTLLSSAATAASDANIKEYSLNDGQVIIKEIYQGSEAIFTAISSFERLKQYYMAKINGRKFRLVHEKNFGRRFFN